MQTASCKCVCASQSATNKGKETGLKKKICALHTMASGNLTFQSSPKNNFVKQFNAHNVFNSYICIN